MQAALAEAARKARADAAAQQLRKGKESVRVAADNSMTLADVLRLKGDL
jgi:hypothetical protein